MKNQKLIIGCDVDGTLTKMAEYFYEHGKFFKKKIVNKTAYDLNRMYGVKKSKVFRWGLIYLRDYCINAKVNKKTKKSIIKMINDGHEVHCITARKYVTQNNIIGAYMRRLVVKYNEKHGINFASYSYCREVRTEREKYFHCFNKKVDLMFEDRPHIAKFLADQGINVGLVDCPYNQNVEYKNVYRLKKISDYEDLVNLTIKQKNQRQRNYNKLKITTDLTNEEYNELSADNKKMYIENYQKKLKELPFDEDNLNLGKKRYNIFYHLIMLVTFRSLFVKIKGKQFLPYNMDVIFVSNHLDSTDQFSIVYGLKKKFITGLASCTIENTIRGKIFKFFKCAIFIDRKNKKSKENGMLELEKTKVRGTSILIFPEGTRKNKYEESKDLEILPFKPGAFNLAQKTSSVIIPVTLCKDYVDSFYTTVIFDRPLVIKPEDDVLKEMEFAREVIMINLRREKFGNENIQI